VIINEVVQFDGSSSMDPDGTIVSYVWNFGDQKSGSGVKVTHIYSTKGLYPVTLTVTDNDGIVGSDGAVITVITSGEATQDLRKVVDDLGLPSGIENALMAKLDAALKSITAGKYRPAKNQLQSFINQVNAMRGKSLTNTQADALIQYAQRIMKSLT
jgi:hypothetical protein